MENRGLLFIPDISGFTRFINETEIDHSRLILQELLEVLINANQIDLQISEIEGDAILFYKFGEPPSIEALYMQVENMFRSFHQSISAYDTYKYCQCKACRSAIGLTLKIITHYGEFTQYQVRQFNKLVGKDLIVAHQLLKNEIKSHEYWLITSPLAAKASDELPATLSWERQSFKTESGDINFYFSPLSTLKESLSSPEPGSVDKSNLKMIVSMTKVYNTDIITLFHATGDFRYRHRWRQGVKKVEEVNHFLPRVGMKCRCIGENGESFIYSSSYQYNDSRIEFTETEERTHSTMAYILEKIDDNHTSLTLQFFIRKQFMALLISAIYGKKKIESDFSVSMEKLNRLISEIHIPAPST